ncbi:MAG: Asp-tRNA(Asn)/Glu-tRNA(Gln) amidotransferase subunit GatC [Candidatus Marinimicrobia bacterium]|jgi:aspartyl-tRNA(Asn)/glutamyl-tRNA(Gln) amidotransferase subunit C|nr:Asp-tRNA(Asn)/Glu-tRNA(Gln) amidotransferase subunit GatC [Candidatus Neomarinimicrobiota bacterium]MDD4961391.1 Asp-tRNA(Asn)/Glu-tRNA(Gln) amidotransferase subunit GatC [Candidatus Neomarinimicrobiota bacterium]MDD5709916.1 Asp-tRNA(Asn)/Glu-tRNA(Gln) amidotransferase subunit GatC [Candidatus Neomarinimicrobiota bacterium]MDX9778335.1 Asp-tRNA(Asn)/Glu-tRNA(Gln) amidotransferase subunit GatC [bacterium]
MALSRKEVIYIAGLARLKLSEEEIERYTRQLSDILGYVEQLQELDVENVAPMSHVLDIVNVMREDKALPPLDREVVLANAAEHDGRHFKVPRVIKE